MKIKKSPNTKVFKEDIFQLNTDPVEDEWNNIQKKIDKEYEKKLQEVSEEAMHKMKAFKAEHKALLDKTQYLKEKDMMRAIPEPLTRRDSVAEQIRQLHDEYQDVLSYDRNVLGDIYLVDVLAKLHLINGDMTSEKAREVFDFIGISK